MALIDTESFSMSPNFADYTTFSKWSAGAPENNTIIVNGSPFAQNYLSIQGDIYGASTKKSFKAAATVYWGARINLNNSVQLGNTMISLSDGANLPHIQLVINSAGGGMVTSPNNQTPFGYISAGHFPLNRWFYLEIGAYMSSIGTGFVTVRVNENVILNAQNINTYNLASAVLPVSLIQITPDTRSERPMFITDWYICDDTGTSNNTFLGDVRIIPMFPTANAAVSFTPTGNTTNWQNAATVPPAPGTDYNSDATLNDQDTFAHATLPVSATVIFGVNVKSIASKSDAGPRSLENVVVSSGIAATGVSTSLGTVPEQIATVFQVDPATSVAWTPAAVNASNIGYKVSA